jgi:mRNA-degrading endonuclease toxin of MazEF toxin-antitoxin module
MEQFSICHLRGDPNTLVIVLQSDLIDEQQTQIVAPLIPIGVFPRLIRLNPTIRLKEQEYMIVMDQMLSIPTRRIERRIGSALAKRDEISRALDYLFKGF